jgi:gamma-glutamyl:cysteine ligase YbdK (ATP-grasp superfamily)
MEYDYLCSDAEDLSQYLVYQNSQIKEIQQYLKEHSDEAGLDICKVETLIFQELQHKEITEMLFKKRIVSEESYEWQKQIRCYYSIDSACTRFLTN